ncbi:transcriptional regulator, TetR family [Alkaliphilus metalliredigens QYMF]|uniref:Transcriptional regulator, TetR family n=1 Tax=Alkaliphilus metalliredigens (strain QYMF) TaxID=293826 RepID=A6TX23_ALKMQ|nr:TetR/AcrR family transcriptional regulator [Alkaliphilus metalliredigens]ABR50741.1 transcriptional regulator, TetR family [Alkaliphilus metalliredigens QYMF]
MPKQTFFNLPDEKRERIIGVAIEEFSKNSFDNASISKVAERANIAKGSLYQYFEDKKDLYKFMIDIATQKKMHYLKDCLEEMDELRFFELIKKLYVRGILFAKENPQLVGIANHFLKENDVKFKEEILGMGLEKSNQFLEQLIEERKQRGEINPEIDTKFGAHMISTLNTSIVDYLLNDIRYEEMIQDERRLLEMVDKMLFIIEKGFTV